MNKPTTLRLLGLSLGLVALTACLGLPNPTWDDEDGFVCPLDVDVDTGDSGQTSEPDTGEEEDAVRTNALETVSTSFPSDTQIAFGVRCTALHAGGPGASPTTKWLSDWNPESQRFSSSKGDVK
ncbi:MAG: hypothetical protein GY913_19325 [Proteobacteria bacterium]|nr:hypothetical protein [Pseudomonadota bacterium]MCP4919062.1 hypothetical protein [Pseudomonadota bacterium]